VPGCAQSKASVRVARDTRLERVFPSAAFPRAHQTDPISCCHEPGRAELFFRATPHSRLSRNLRRNRRRSHQHVDAVMQAQPVPQKSWTPRGGPSGSEGVAPCSSCACDVNEYVLCLRERASDVTSPLEHSPDLRLLTRQTLLISGGSLQISGTGDLVLSRSQAGRLESTREYPPDPSLRTRFLVCHAPHFSLARSAINTRWRALSTARAIEPLRAVAFAALVNGPES
jgi:hypothetical protein